MFFVTFCKIISALLGIVGASFIIPLIVALIYGENSVILPFVIPMVVSFIVMLAINIPTRKFKIKMNIKQTFLIVASAWIFISLMGALPLYFSGAFPNFSDAFFESVSGFTTTGATVCPDVEILHCSINMWRALSHWIGGMGIVTLTVALLPLLGVGGFQLIKAETTGPEKGKITARITTTAKVLWAIYTSLTVLEAILLKIFGMNWTDAIIHAFSTLGTGGFSSKNASVGAYNSLAIDVVITIFMFLAAINFNLYFYLFTGKFSEIKNNSELKAYVGIVFFMILLLTIALIPFYSENFFTSFRYSAFQVVSIISTTGFQTAGFIAWSSVAQFFIFILFFIGGCSGSTAGGVKIIRWVILCKQINNETRRMLHPHGVFSIRLNNKAGRKDIVFSVAAFLMMYILLVFVTTLIGCIGHLDLFSALTGAASMVGNVGAGFGALNGNFAFLPSFIKWWYCFAMLAGRLELYTMIIFFMPVFWHK